MSLSAIILGVASQDGSYLAELLLAQGYKVIGTTRKSGDNTEFIRPIEGKYISQTVDLLVPESITAVIKKYRPSEFYHLAAFTVPSQSWQQPALVGQATGLAVATSLEAIFKYSPRTKFFHPSSSAMFGSPKTSVVDENTAFNPQNPYAVAKVYGHHMTKIYRSKGLFAVNGILFNHDSPRRSPDFVVKIVTSAVAAIKLKRRTKLHLWDAEAQRDWGYAKDYVRAMWLMLQNKKPVDYVVATGKLHSVEEVCKIAFSAVGLDWKKYVVIDGRPDRRPETPGFAGDASAIHRDLGWQPKTTFKELIRMMVTADISRVS